jgi:aldose 1-epimerase
VQIVTLSNGHLQAQVVPAIGGSLARLDALGSGAPFSLLRAFEPGMGVATPSHMACFPLVPWSNRIGTAGFDFEGRRIALPPNRAGELCPIHGEGWQQEWEVESTSSTSVALLLDRRACAPFSYVARLRYSLAASALDVGLEVTNCGNRTLPFGLGLHPWLPRTEGVLLRAGAVATWERGIDGLPMSPIAIPDDWNFSTARQLPVRGIDNVFSGWDGEAEIVWPESGQRLCISSDMDYYIVYTRPDANFFCFEPVDHMINAHNLEGGPARHGLRLLAPGETLTRSVAFSHTPVNP